MSLNKIENNNDKYVVIHRGYLPVWRTSPRVIKLWQPDQSAPGKFLAQVF